MILLILLNSCFSASFYIPEGVEKLFGEYKKELQLALKKKEEMVEPLFNGPLFEGKVAADASEEFAKSNEWVRTEIEEMLGANEELFKTMLKKSTLLQSYKGSTDWIKGKINKVTEISFDYFGYFGDNAHFRKEDSQAFLEEIKVFFQQEESCRNFSGKFMLYGMNKDRQHIKKCFGLSKSPIKFSKDGTVSLRIEEVPGKYYSKYLGEATRGDKHFYPIFFDEEKVEVRKSLWDEISDQTDQQSVLELLKTEAGKEDTNGHWVLTFHKIAELLFEKKHDTSFDFNEVVPFEILEFYSAGDGKFLDVSTNDQILELIRRVIESGETKLDMMKRLRELDAASNQSTESSKKHLETQVAQAEREEKDLFSNLSTGQQNFIKTLITTLKDFYKQSQSCTTPPSQFEDKSTQTDVLPIQSSLGTNRPPVTPLPKSSNRRLLKQMYQAKRPSASRST